MSKDREATSNSPNVIRLSLGGWDENARLEPLLATLNRHGRHLEKRNVGMHGNPTENFRQWLSEDMTDLESRNIGSVEHVTELYLQAYACSALIGSLEQQFEETKARPSGRAQAAARNLWVAAQSLPGGLLLLLRPEVMFDWHAIAIARTTMEVTGRAALIATGQGDETTRWNAGERFSAPKCISALSDSIKGRRPNAPDVNKVYGWMCWFTHLNSSAIQRTEDDPTTLHLDAYAALAFAAWSVAVVTEVVTGERGLAQWPSTWPEPLPWDSLQ